MAGTAGILVRGLGVEGLVAGFGGLGPRGWVEQGRGWTVTNSTGFRL